MFTPASVQNYIFQSAQVAFDNCCKNLLNSPEEFEKLKQIRSCSKKAKGIERVRAVSCKEGRKKGISRQNMEPHRAASKKKLDMVCGSLGWDSFHKNNDSNREIWQTVSVAKATSMILSARKNLQVASPFPPMQEKGTLLEISSIHGDISLQSSISAWKLIGGLQGKEVTSVLIGSSHSTTHSNTQIGVNKEAAQNTIVKDLQAIKKQRETENSPLEKLLLQKMQITRKP